jgi:peptidoglycan/LPS O-acetylase OafA/YrhL
VALIADVSVFHDRSLAATLPVTLLAPCLILGTVLHPSSLAGRLLESRPLRLIGVMSYSIYLWQSVFYTRAWTHVTPLGRFNEFPLNAIGTLLVAALSYYLIEVPFQKLGHRLAPNVPRMPSLAAKRVLNQIA